MAIGRYAKHSVMGCFQYDYVKLPPQRQIGLHSQRTWELDYILTGSGVRIMGDSREPFREGEVVLVPPEMPHCWNFDSNCTDSGGNIANISIIFDDQLLDSILMSFPDMRECIAGIRDRRDTAIFYSGDTLKKLAVIMNAMNEESASQRPASFLRILSLLGCDSDAMRSEACLKINSDERRKMKIRTFISCNCLRSVSLKEVASYVGMNESAFCVFFKKLYGQTFVRYLNAQRLEYARYLLENGNMTVTDVCYASGFASPPYFSRIFRRAFGVSAQQYAKSFLNKNNNI